MKAACNSPAKWAGTGTDGAAIIATREDVSSRLRPGSERAAGSGMKDTERLSFGALLRQHRQRLGLTQEELAERAELSVRQLAYLEQDRHVARPGTVRRLAGALALTEREH